MFRPTLFAALFTLFPLAGCNAQKSPNSDDLLTQKSDDSSLQEPTSNAGPADEKSAVSEITPLPSALDSRPGAITRALDDDFSPEVAALPNFIALNGPKIASVLPAPPLFKPTKDARIAGFQQKIAKYQLFSAYENLISLHKNAGQSDEAARLSRQQAALYRAKGLTDAAIIKTNDAANLETEIRAFVETRVSAKNAGKLDTRAALEPVTGCYLGAFIDRDSTLGPPFWDENRRQWHRAPSQFAAKTGRHPGSLFTYLKYGNPFPRAWAERLRESGCIPHIAWEPQSLNQVRDDEYLNQFARAIRAFDFPVFVRFASEMNGNWTIGRWGGNPPLYKTKFRLVHQVLHRNAPKVATIWCVNNPPLKNAFDYYPGDDGCDWVGVNLYSVPFHDNRRDRPAFDESPLALLEPIYKRYAAKKPIAICEFAASQRSNVDKKPIPNFARDKMRLLYGALPLLYPRVKLIDWFNNDTIKNPVAGKNLNNYLLTDNAQVLKSWQNATNSRHFLTRYLRLADQLPPVYKPLNNQKIQNPMRFAIWSKSGAGGTLFVALDGQFIAKTPSGGAFGFDLNAAQLAPGKHQISAFLYDSKNRFQRKISVNFSK